MKREEVLSDFKARFNNDIVDFLDKHSKRVYIEIKPESLVKLATYIFKELKARFIIASGMDLRNQMEILYHFILEDINLMISLRVRLDKSRLEVDSLSNVIEGANWIEREIYELLGIKFKNHPELKRLLLSEDWPEGVYPLRRDYEEWDKNVIRDRGV